MLHNQVVSSLTYTDTSVACVSIYLFNSMDRGHVDGDIVSTFLQAKILRGMSRSQETI